MLLPMFLEITLLALILAGAQAKNGCLFITMPEHPKFGSLSDRDAERIFRYLVGLARYDWKLKTTCLGFWFVNLDDLGRDTCAVHCSLFLFLQNDCGSLRQWLPIESMVCICSNPFFFLC